MPSRSAQVQPQLLATCLLLLAGGLLVGMPLRAAPQPRPGFAPGGCPWIVPSGQEFVQPARIPADRVERKNAGGCLSQNDAIYGSDGCPLRFCQYREVGPLPPPDPSVKLQLPTQPAVP